MITDMSGQPMRVPPKPDEEITVGELLRKIDEARGKMSRKNEHRHLLLQCKAAIVHLSKRVIDDEEVRTQSGIILA